MKNVNIIFSLFAAMLLASCTESKNGASGHDFDSPSLISYDSVAIDEIISPTKWLTVKGSKAFVFSYKTDSLFFVYGLPEWKYLYSFGQRGEGPEDYQYGTVWDSPSHPDAIMVREYRSAGARERTLRLGDSAPEMVTDTVKKVPVGLTRIYDVNDSVMLVTSLPSWNRGDFEDYKLYIATANSKGVIDSTLSFAVGKYKLEKGDGGFGITGNSYNDPFTFYRDGKLYVLYGDGGTRRLDIFSISEEGRMTLDKTVGAQYTWDEIQTMVDKENGETVYSVSWGDEYIYAFACSWEDMGTWHKVINSYVEVYDYDGNKIKKFDLGRNFNRFMADEENGYFYVHHTGYDFEWVYRYKYDL